MIWRSSRISRRIISVSASCSFCCSRWWSVSRRSCPPCSVRVVRCSSGSVWPWSEYWPSWPSTRFGGERVERLTVERALEALALSTREPRCALPVPGVRCPRFARTPFRACSPVLASAAFVETTRPFIPPGRGTLPNAPHRANTVWTRPSKARHRHTVLARCAAPWTSQQSGGDERGAGAFYRIPPSTVRVRSLTAVRVESPEKSNGPPMTCRRRIEYLPARHWFA